MSYIKKLRQRLDNKEISAVELMNDYLDKIQKYDGEINSVITLAKE